MQLFVQDDDGQASKALSIDRSRELFAAEGDDLAARSREREHLRPCAESL